MYASWRFCIHFHRPNLLWWNSACSWIIEELRRKLRQDAVLCPESALGSIPVTLPTGSCTISPRDSPQMGGTIKEKEVVWARGGGVPYIMGHFGWYFPYRNIPCQLNLSFHPWYHCILSWMHISLSLSSPGHAIHEPQTLLRSYHESQWAENCAPNDLIHYGGAHNLLIVLLALFLPKHWYTSCRTAMPFRIPPNKKRILTSVSCYENLMMALSCLFLALYHLFPPSFHFSAACCSSQKCWCRQMQNINLILAYSQAENYPSVFRSCLILKMIQAFASL